MAPSFGDAASRAPAGASPAEITALGHDPEARLRRAVARSSVADATETLDAWLTADVKYALASRREADALRRAGAIAEAVDAHERFLALTRAIEAMPRAEVEAYEREANADGRDEATTRARTRGGDGTTGRNDAREEKVRRYRAKRAVETRLETIRATLARRDGGDGDEDEEDEDGDALEREFWTLTLERAVYESLDELPTLRVESEMLARRSELEDARERERERMANEDERVGRRAPEIYTIERDAAAMSLAADVVRVDPRARMRSEVFRPSHILPTMTIEQAGEIERAEMLERRAREVERARLAEIDRASKSEDQLEEEALRKARAWDEFKDDNPYGGGNSKLRPCG